MNCKLCEKPILKYNPAFSHLKIDQSHEADLCQDCINKIMKWQQKIYANLFPSKTAKKWAERKNFL